MPAAGSIQWSDEFALVEADSQIVRLLTLLAADGPYYILIRRAPDLLYVFLADELRRFPHIHKFDFVSPPVQLTIGDAIEFHEPDSSQRSRLDGLPLPYPYLAAEDRPLLPSRDRWVAVDSFGEPVAVGELTARMTLGGDRQPRVIDLERVSLVGAEPPVARSRARSAVGNGGTGGAAADEGTDPVRYPSIRADRELAAGQPVVITVDLLRELLDRETVSGGVAITDLAADWAEINVSVELFCAAIVLEPAQGVVNVRRNADSVPAVFEGLVDAGLKRDQAVRVTAVFSFGGRDCGIARRTFAAGTSAPLEPAPESPTPLVVETAVQAPVLTVRILMPDAALPGKLLWTLVVPRADQVPGLPARLTESIDLGTDPAMFVAKLYETFANVLVGQHVDLFRAFGDELWLRAPESFRRAYWALHAAVGSGFTIQFVTDDPHVPWELMRPSDEQTGKLGEILALGHPVARWIGAYEGTLRQRLADGRVATIAPKYASVMDALPRAQEEAQLLTAGYRAVLIPGTLDGVKRFLRGGMEEPVAIVHFAGHGEFPPGMPANSSIKLEDGSLLATVVKARETTLGHRDGPLVIFNACKVGATGEALGASGGWADVFLERRFRGFVAPLWPVYDEDAALVVSEFFDAVVTKREPVGSVLQQIRARHAQRSPTFFAYLYYGDVNARLPKAIA